MSTQPEALRLADAIDPPTLFTSTSLRHHAAEELRRLHAANVELLEACRAIVAWDDAENEAPDYQSDGGAHWRYRQQLCGDAFDKSRAAIAKHGSTA